MADTATSRVEPSMEPGFVPPADGTVLAPSATAEPAFPPQASSSATDQLSRIEEKAARIEEKYARAEALLQRVESKMDSASGRMAEGARQADLTAVREQVTALSRVVRNLPGLTSLILVAIVTSVLTSAITLALMKYGIPGILPR